MYVILFITLQPRHHAHSGGQAKWTS